MSPAGGMALTLFLLCLVFVLTAVLIGQLRQRNALRDWLEVPERPMPDGRGAWRDLFSRLQRLRKEDGRRFAALRGALDRFQRAAEALPDGVILLDKDGYIEWLNPAGCQHFALNAERDLGTLIEQLIRQTEFLDFLEAFWKGTAPDTLLLKRNGSHPEVSLAVMLIPFADTGTLLLSRDVSDLTRSETIRRDFVANVSHELRTPLTVISGFLEQFTSDHPPAGEAARTFFKLMADQSLRMNRLVDDLLTLSRLENDSQPPRDESVDVPALVDALRDEAIALSAGRHTVRSGEICAARLRGSFDELRSAFGNLVSNAVRYTPAGGTITLAWKLEGNSPCFSVTDTGIGIPPEHIPRLTERFYRVDKGRSTAAGGTGLGLAIVKHVLVRHGGSLRIESFPGQGSTFFARLPNDRLIFGT